MNRKYFLQAVALVGFGLFTRVGMSAAPAAPKKPAAAVTNAVAEFKIPLSVFVIPKAPQEGRDPFYPKSMRPYAQIGPIVSSPTNSPAPLNVDLKFKGRSGTADHPLAIVNNHTFEPGEEAEVLASGNRVRIRCLEIRSDSVIIQIPGGERRELRLRGEFLSPTTGPKADTRTPVAAGR
jgi:hypothetical protein